MSTQTSKAWCIVSLALGLATLLGVSLIAAQPSAPQVPKGAPRYPPGNPPQASPTATPACPPSWNVVSSPNAGTGSDFLMGVAATSANDVWAAGYYNNGRDL